MTKLTFAQLQIIIHILSGTIAQYRGTLINSTQKRLKFSTDVETLIKSGIIYYNTQIDLEGNNIINLIVNGSRPEIKKLYDDYKYAKR